MDAIEVRRVQFSHDLAKAGDYCLVPKRDPIVTVERKPLAPPSGLFRRILWQWFGRKDELKTVIEELWPAYDAIIVNCPRCVQPCATTAKHEIVSVEPLTIATSITTFKVTDGKLITA